MALLIGKPAPEFCATAVEAGQIKENFSLHNLKGKYICLFFYPLDFTFVCPTELHAFQERLSDFESRNCAVVACSVDSHYSHLAWLDMPKKAGGIKGITYPILSDLNKTIASDYDLLVPGKGVAYRGLFLIDKAGIVRHQSVNDLNIGRNVDETLRLLDALIFAEKHGEVCPANWSRGKTAMKPTQEGVAAYFSQN